MIRIVLTHDDQGNLIIQAEAPPYVVIGELAQAIALLTVQLANAQNRVLPANGLDLSRLPPPRDT